jgi:hypothetical protein
MEGSAFLKVVVEVFPYKIHTVLTDNGMAFADLPKNREGPSRRFLGPHIFDRVCMANAIEHRLTKPYHPWTNGQGPPHLEPSRFGFTHIRRARSRERNGLRELSAAYNASAPIAASAARAHSMSCA